jgi:hypothetical protein
MSTPRNHILLEVDFVGVTYRMSDGTFEVPNADENNTLSFQSGFDDVSMQQAMAFLATAPAALTVPIQTILPVDVAAMYAAGWQLARSPARLSVWREGTDYAQRLQLIDGIVTAPSWRYLGDPVSFSIELPESTRETEYPPVSQQINSDTIGELSVLTLSLDELNVTYPTVFGSPGKTGDTSWVPATQGVWYIHQGEGLGAGLRNFLRLILAGHHVTGGWVTLCGDADLNPNGHRFRVANTYDLLGQPVAVVYESSTPWTSPSGGGNTRQDMMDGNWNMLVTSNTDANPENGGWFYGLNEQGTPNVADLTPNLDPTLYQPTTIVPVLATPSNPTTTPTTSSVFAAWREYTSSTYQGDGIVGLSPLAGDVITYMLERSGLKVDYARMASASAALKSYRFDCVVDSPVKPLEWLETNVLPFLPASVVSGNDGWYVVVWRRDAIPADATVVLDVLTDPDIRLVGDVNFDSDVINRVSLQYQYDVQHSTYTATAWRGGAPKDHPAEGIYGLAGGPTTYDPGDDAYSVISQTVFKIQTRAYTSACIYDSATAGRVLSDRIRAFGQPRMRATYTVPRSYGLELGQVVTLTDPQLSLYSRVALVEQIEIDSTGLDGIRLLFIADPLRDTVGV